MADQMKQTHNIRAGCGMPSQEVEYWEYCRPQTNQT